MRIHHIALQVTDLTQARTFYETILGFTVSRVQPHSVWLAAGDSIVMLETCSGAVASTEAWADPRPGPFVVAFGISPQERGPLRERLTAGGVVIDHETDFSMYLRDPFGARLAFSHYPDKAPP
jgi:glyoxylase I family protein